MQKNYHTGQTLLELLTALFVLGLALVGALGLTNSNFRLEGIGSSRLTATNLAREGVELARAIRDTNWLKGESFDAGLEDGQHCAVIASGQNTPLVDHFFFLPCADVFDGSYKLYRSSDGRYASADTFGDPSSIYRRIRLDPICLTGEEETVLDSAQCEPGTKIGVAIQATVGWHYAGQSMNVSLNERLYDWQ